MFNLFISSLIGFYEYNIEELLFINKFIFFQVKRYIDERSFKTISRLGRTLLNKLNYSEPELSHFGLQISIYKKPLFNGVSIKKFLLCVNNNTELTQHVAVDLCSHLLNTSCKLIKSASDKFYRKIQLVMLIIWYVCWKTKGSQRNQSVQLFNLIFYEMTILPSLQTTKTQSPEFDPFNLHNRMT